MGTYSDLVQTSTTSTPKNEKIQITKKRTSERSLEATDQRNKQRTVRPTKQPTIEVSNNRMMIRHTFDIFDDQLQALYLYQLECVQNGSHKPKMGDMIQEALDGYLAKQGVGKNDLKNERSNDPTIQRQ